MTPDEGSLATIAYTSTIVTEGLLDGTPIESAKSLTFTVGDGQVAKCVDLAIRKMSIGAKALVTCMPEHLLDKNDPSGPLGQLQAFQQAVIQFSVELVHFERTAEELRAEEGYFSVKEKLESISSGLSKQGAEIKSDEEKEMPDIAEFKLTINNEASGLGEFPQPGNLVTVVVKGFYSNGDKFLDRWKQTKPIKFVFGEGIVVKCFDMAVAKMKVGHKARVECPNEYLYGDQGHEALPPGASAIYDLGLAKITDLDAEEAEEEAKAVKEEKKPLYIVSVSGEGEGSFPREGNHLKVNYIGKFEDGTVFETSGEKGPIKFLLYNWDAPNKCIFDSMFFIKEGQKAELLCPPEAAYKDNGVGDKIPPGATLIYEVELVKSVTQREVTTAVREKIERIEVSKKIDKFDFQLLRAGDGKGKKPVVGEIVTCNYKMTVVSTNKLVYSSYDTHMPMEFIMGSNSQMVCIEKGIKRMMKG